VLQEVPSRRCAGIGDPLSEYSSHRPAQPTIVYRIGTVCYSLRVKIRTGLRSKLYIMIIPHVLLVVALSGALAFLASREAITRVATRHLAYKAEQLRDFAHSEWEAITDLGLEEDPRFRIAAQESLRSYAASLLRSPSEAIVAFDTRGDTVMRVGGTGESDDELRDGNATGGGSSLDQPPESGWFSGDLFGQSRVGVVFDLESFEWTVAVTELQEAFFTDAERIQRTHLGILLAAIVSVTLFVWFYVGYLIRPIERLTDTIRHITTTNDLSRRATVEFRDEVGVLANGFNRMITRLERKQVRLQEAMEAEKTARETAIEREEETLLLLGHAAEFRDRETGEHLKRIGLLAELLAELLGVSREKQELIRRSSPLHDIGKIGIPDNILLKQGPLTSTEREQMERHTVVGYDLLKDSRSQYLMEGAEIALTHHERWDGTGYPSGLKGTDIPVNGRIVALVDVFDAMTSERPYKCASSPEEAHEEILKGRGKQFDPSLVDLFHEHYPAFRRIVER